VAPLVPRPSLARVSVTGVFAPGRRALTAGLILIVTMVAFEALAVATILPLIEAELGDLHLYGWVFSAFFLGNLVGIVVAGRAADRVRPVVPFVAGVTLFLLGLALGAAAGSMLILVVARALQGLGAGALPAVAYVCIGRAYPPDDRPRMFALLSTAWVVPALIGPAISGFVGETVGWRWVFAGLLPLVAVIAVMVAGAMRHVDAPGTDAPGVSIRDALLVAAGAALLLAGLGADQVVAVVALVAAGLGIALPAFRRLTPAGTLRARPGLPAAIALRGVLTFAFFSADAYVPFVLTSLRGMPAGVAGLALTAATLSWTAGAWVQERRVRRVGPRPLVATGFLLLAIVSGALALVLAPSVPAVVGIPLWGLSGLGMGLAYAPLSLTMLASAAPGQEGAATSALQLSDTLGVALGTGAAGALVALGNASGWDQRLGPLLVFAMAAGVAATGAMLARRLPVSLPVQEETVTA
jgi:MFS family permease